VSEAEALGQRLREAREARELTLEDAERAIRIRAKFLEALERGDYSIMTSVQVQGFLRNYARFLGLDLDLLLSELESGQDRGRRRRHQDSAPAAIPRSVTPAKGTPKPQKRPRPQRGFMGNMLIVLISGGVVVGLIFGLTQLLDRLAATSENNGAGSDDITTPMLPPPVVENADQPVTETPEFTMGQTPAIQYTPPAISGSRVVVSIQLTQRTWMRVTVDGQVAREGMAKPGEVWQFEGQNSVGIRASNAAALQLTVNNQPQGPLGSRGQLFDYTFSLDNTSSIPPAEPGLSPTPAASDAQAASPEQATLLFTATNTLAPGGLDSGPMGNAPTAQIASPEAPATSVPTTEVPESSPTPATVAITEQAAPTRTLTPTSLPTATISATPSATPSRTPFLPPRITRTPSPPPKP